MNRYYQEIRPYREYLHLMENFLQKEEARLSEFLATYEGPTSYEAISPLDVKYETEKFNQITGYVEELYFMHSLPEFSNILRRSLFVNLYSFLESRMLKICRDAEYQTSLSLSDLRGTGVDKAKVYLTKVVGISFDFGRDWEEIQNLKLLRHCVAHNEGKIDDGFGNGNMTLRVYIGSRSHLSLNSNGTISFEKEFCEEVLNIIERFLEVLVSKVPTV